MVIQKTVVEGILGERFTDKKKKNSSKRISSCRHDQQKLEVVKLVVKWSKVENLWQE